MKTSPESPAHPHQGQPILFDGEPLGHASAAMLMFHGRGADARDILALSSELPRDGVAFCAPQAAGSTWYPNRFLAPLHTNEPWLSSALTLVRELMDRLAAERIPAERVVLLGFSQGACLALEYAARNARRYGGLVGLSGGLIGPDDTPRDYGGSLAGTPVFLGCSDVDFHIPADRVDLTADVLRRLGGRVTRRFYPGMGHAINQDEIGQVRAMVARLMTGTATPERKDRWRFTK